MKRSYHCNNWLSRITLIDQSIKYKFSGNFKLHLVDFPLLGGIFINTDSKKSHFCFFEDYSSDSIYVQINELYFRIGLRQDLRRTNLRFRYHH